jgi:hypothetical protein
MRNAILPLLLAALPVLSQDAGTEYFEKNVRPLLLKNCSGCHNPKMKSAGLDLSSVEGIAMGGQSGSLIVKGKAEDSLLFKVVTYDERLKMPPSGKLAATDIKALNTWIQAGAPGVTTAPAAGGGALQTRKHGRGISDAERKFWAFQPVSNPQPPAVKDTAWVKSPVDSFILAKLESKGLKPASPADRAALLRRVTFGLTGLAPTIQETRDFLTDSSANALEKVIDRLLASPRYGEHWGRHWLDVARYADSTGNDEDHRYPYAFRYRDYVIESFNKDVPFDHFLREQIAGDLMPPGPGEKVNRNGIIATGFLALGAKAVAQQDKKKMLVDVYDEQIDVVSKGVLGITMACARCHDHKFDPILTKDYYSWNTIFANTKNFNKPDQHVASLLYRPLAPEEEYERFVKGRELSDKKLSEMLDLIEDQTSSYTLDLGSRTADYMLAARDTMAGRTPAAKGLQQPVVDKWVSFLKESKTKRSYLKDWLEATDATAPQIASKYQARYLAKQAEWSKAMVRTRKQRRNRNLAMPPKIAADDDVFFFDVHYAGPYGLKEAERASVWPAAKISAIQKLDIEVKEILAGMPPEPDMACAVKEGTEGVVAGKVYVRGDYNALGEDAPKGVPEVLTGVLPAPQFAETGSGRLELAGWLTRPENPLTARVFVNRMWYWHFGEGLVRTPDNFGRMGEKPTHPELLDYLAQQFMQNGWSVKKMQKLILLSSAYQMSSLTNDETVAKDQDNSLLSRFPRRRLSVEELRDSMLGLDGTIDLTMGGTMQSGFGTDGENSNDRLSIRPDDVKRRTVYLPLRRANLPGLLNLFDFGDATSSASKRPSTTIAPQALFLMNSSFISDRARNLSQQAAANAANPSDRMKSLFLKILGREATASEIDNALSYLNQFQRKFAGKRSPDDAWLSFSRILLASNEYIYLD